MKKLEVQLRKEKSRGSLSRLRREGYLPAVLYGKGISSQSIAISEAAFEAHLRLMPKGRLSTTLFHLEGEGINCSALVKEIQYEVTTYKKLHLDFQEVHEDEVIQVRVPIEFTGTADAPGLKEGGSLRLVTRSLKVRCKPSQIPERFILSVGGLGLRQSKKLRDIEFPEGVDPLGDLNQIAIVIAKR